MTIDQCVQVVQDYPEAKWNLVSKALKKPLTEMMIYEETPRKRFLEVVTLEVTHLSSRALKSLDELDRHRAIHEATAPYFDAARAALRAAVAEKRFPGERLKQLVADVGSRVVGEQVRAQIQPWIERHERLYKRLEWLIDPRITLRRMDALDPEKDADELVCHLSYTFRPELTFIVWGNAIERIAQVPSTATFFHSTGKAEIRPLLRTIDTSLHYVYFFNWGVDSYHGSKAVENMNRFHGRYFIHNDGMKFVLLNGVFTILEGLDRIGHRPLLDKVKLGYFHGLINMGTAMNIRNLSHSWDEMHGWFYDLAKATADYHPLKRRSFVAIQSESLRQAKLPALVNPVIRAGAVCAMDDTYRTSLGYPKPSKIKANAFRKFFRVANFMRSLMPRGPFVPSLFSYLTYPEGAPIEGVGETTRSERMPSSCPFAAPRLSNKGYPENQLPLDSVGDARETQLETLTWETVRLHDKEDDLWTVFGGYVYDVSSFAKVHPGGLKIFLENVGKDMTAAFEGANHSEITKVFALNYRIGKIEAKRSKAPLEVSGSTGSQERKLALVASS